MTWEKKRKIFPRCPAACREFPSLPHNMPLKEQEEFFSYSACEERDFVLYY